MEAKRIGLLGGTFDPVHAGHVDLARTCARRLALDQVRFLAARVPPHKRGPQAGGHDRHAMLALALAGEQRFVPDARELRREGRSYTIDTLDELVAERPGAELFFLAGADSLRDLPGWRRPEDILRRAVFVAVEREGECFETAAAPHAAAIAAGRVVLIEHRPPPFSSSRLRELLGRGTALPEGALDPAVRDYIDKTDLYSATPRRSRP